MSDERDEIEAGADLLEPEIEAAKRHLRSCPNRREGGASIVGCTSYIQRKMGIGYNHAARIMEYLEIDRFITKPDASGARRLISN